MIAMVHLLVMTMRSMPMMTIPQLELRIAMPLLALMMLMVHLLEMTTTMMMPLPPLMSMLLELMMPMVHLPKIPMLLVMMLQPQPMKPEPPEADLVRLAVEAAQEPSVATVPLLQDLPQPVPQAGDHPPQGDLLPPAAADNNPVVDVHRSSNRHLGVDADVD